MTATPLSTDAAPRDADRPNLLLIMVDQMQAQLLDAEPPPHAAIGLPHLRRLASRSARFHAAFCPAPICTPCRASLQLGQRPSRHGVLGNDRPMPPGPTFADRLRDAGYVTAYAGKWHLDRDDPRGWASHDTGQREWARRQRDAGLTPDRGAAVMADAESPHVGVAPDDASLHLDGVVRDLAIARLGGLAGSGVPFALTASFYGPHAPYVVPERWHDPALLDVPLPDDLDDPLDGKPAVQSSFRCRAWGETWSDGKWRRVRAGYFAYARMLDAFVGELLGALAASPAADRTLVAFFSDHGELNGHHRMVYKGPMMYDPLVRVPMLIARPGLRGGEGADVDGLVSLIDLPVTLLAAAGAEPLPDADGADLWPALSDHQPHRIGRPHVVSEFHEANWVDPVVRQRVAMARTATHKYVLTEGQGEELYVLAERPPEVNNRAGDPAMRDTLDRLRGVLIDELPWTADAFPVSRSS